MAPPATAERAPAVQVVLRPIGSPLTVGMSGLAIASLVQSGFDLGWVSHAEAGEVGLILLAVPGLLQLIGCLLSYLARDGATGAAMGTLTGSWIALGLIRLLGPATTTNALGLMLLSAGLMLILSASAVAVAKPLPSAVLVLAGVRFLLGGLGQLTALHAWTVAAGIIGLVILGLAAYTVLAFELEGQCGRPILPTFRRAIRRRASLSPPSTEPEQAAALALEELVREPGVRWPG
jgi:succinate-acetate transporter protein